MRSSNQRRLPTYLHLLAFGLLFAALFAGAQLAGWRECTTIISATLPTPNANWNGTAFRAGAYLVVYFCALILTPSFVFAAGLEWAWCRFRSRRVQRPVRNE